jgi:hypothetical protein
MATLYNFVSSEQITAQAIKSGVYFLAQFPKNVYNAEGAVAPFLNGLANGFNSYAIVPGVVAISAVQEITANNQLEDKIDVTVESTSGKSTVVIRTDYPSTDFQSITLEHFVALVEATRAHLDSVEAG